MCVLVLYIVVQHLTVFFPQIRPFVTYCITQAPQDTRLIFFFYHLTNWKELVINNAIVVKKAVGKTLIFDLLHGPL